ncbi:MAG: hypothetical protein D6739_01885, partial [Nitrospirae bacterium]
GLDRPAAGSGRLLGAEVAVLTPAEALRLLRRIGVVWRHGGLITNLSLGANALLAATYHGRPGRPVEAEAVHLLRRLGLPTDAAALGRLPAEVEPWLCRLVGMVRAWLTRPEVVVYDGLLEELPRGLRRRVARVARELAKEGGAATLHVTTDASTAERLAIRRVVRPGGAPPAGHQPGGTG